jgi:hypothetical protein
VRDSQRDEQPERAEGEREGDDGENSADRRSAVDRPHRCNEPYLADHCCAEDGERTRTDAD